MDELYEMLFKRKSIRKYDENLKITPNEINDIKKKIDKLIPLMPEIKTTYKIVKRTETNCKWGEYCILIYSEEKENYLVNVGYMYEQLDLYLASLNIGVCWYGFGKTDEQYIDKMKYVIMITFGKSNEEDFRQSFLKTKRKELNEIWQGVDLPKITDIIRFAPSACNSQPWNINFDGNELKVYRTTKINSILKIGLVSYYNKIDMGIFLCFLEIALEKFDYRFEKELYNIDGKEDLMLLAKYNIK